MPTFLLKVLVSVTGQHLLGTDGPAAAQAQSKMQPSERQQQHGCLAGSYLEAFAQMGLHCKRVLRLAEDLKKLIV